MIDRGQLEEKLLAAVAELTAARTRLEPLAQEWAIAEQEYRKAQAIALLSAKDLKTIPEKKAYVDSVCSKQMLAAHVADAIREAVAKNVRAIEVEVSAYQTLASLIKSDMALAGRFD